MKLHVRNLFITLLAGLACAYVAEAQRANRANRRENRAAERVPNSAAISAAMGDLRWGMTPKQVLDSVTKRIEKEYQPQLAKAPGAIEEDRLRHDMAEKVRRIRESFVRFDGRPTGWDVSFLRHEFTHRNNEAMFVVGEGDSENYYFFINNKLWKWYKAFKAEIFAGKTFDQFAEAIQGRYGRGRQKTGELIPRGGEQRWLEWQDAKTRLRAVDQTRFYGFYCLVFEDRPTLANLSKLRVNQRPADPDVHPLVKAVTSGEGQSADPDSNPDVVDRITGKIRRPTQAPAPTKGGSPATKAPTQGANSQSGPPPSKTKQGDPLRDLDL